ncbi:hypothetical protein [Gluconobacter japonicus]|uniref:hypothetical protein n=1 Tax=Gluconobacter japonicus TaxID=376620 RepID=UPI0039EA2F35
MTSKYIFKDNSIEQIQANGCSQELFVLDSVSVKKNNITWCDHSIFTRQMKIHAELSSVDDTRLNRFQRTFVALDEKSTMLRRLHTLKTFEGDSDVGYVRPETSAVVAISNILEEMFDAAPYLPAPVISPASDGEVVVSWRRPNAYMVWHFDSGSDFEWVAKGKEYHSGVLDSAQNSVLYLAVNMINAVVGNPLHYFSENYSSSPLDYAFKIEKEDLLDIEDVIKVCSE